MENKQLLKEIIQTYQPLFDQQVAFLIELCSIDSGSLNVAGSQRMVEAIIKQAKQLKLDCVIETKQVAEVGTFLAIIVNPQYTEKVLLSAHTDTVFAEGLVSQHPVHIEGDFFYGLGASDCKGGDTVALYSLAIAQQMGLLKQRQYVLLLDCDEEISCDEGDRFFADYIDNAQYALVYEPARGNNGIVTSRRSLVNADVEVYGKAAHSSVFDRGASAVAALGNLIQKFNQLHDPSRSIYVNCGCLANNGPINQVSDYARMEVSCRVESLEQAEEYFAKYREVCQDTGVPGTTCKLTEHHFELPMARTPGNLALYQLAKEVGKALDLDLAEIAAVGAGDASFFSAQGIATIDALGPYTYGMHVLDEHTSLNSLKERTELSVLLLANL